MFIDYIILSNADKNVSYKYFCKKVDEQNIEIQIENPNSLGVKLNGKIGDFHYTSNLQDIDLMLSFIFELSEQQQDSVDYESRPVSLNDSEADEITENELQPINGVNSSMVEKESLAASKQFSPTEKNNEQKWPVFPGSKNFCDMFLLSSDREVFPFHHTFLSKHSSKFEKMFHDSKTLPLIIYSDLQSSTLKAVIDFLNDSQNPSVKAAVQNNLDIFFFAEEWKISSLIVILKA
uniref:BTB domain-containing protein n=1 Tax=Panagrolaimus sp. ES5 TaxID=591445 RepID=A0AC34GPH8_9BILA